jgi:hypothetical protein
MPSNAGCEQLLRVALGFHNRGHCAVVPRAEFLQGTAIMGTTVTGANAVKDGIHQIAPGFIPEYAQPCGFDGLTLDQRLSDWCQSDVFTVEESHHRCDGRPNTLTLMSDRKGTIFAVFTPVQ